MFHLDDDKPILYSIVTYLLDLFFHTPPEMYPLMDKVASVTEIWNPRTTDPFLQQAHDDMERDWQFDGLTNMCRAFRLAPNQGRDDGGGITFDHPALARLVISPLLRYLTTDIDDFFKKMETSCVVLDSDECKPNIVFDLAQHPTRKQKQKRKWKRKRKRK
ncbi:hypothetical protein EJ05DRAFT_256786 [Pseudovirgaria hyperparasitica]|uniref:Uncharacterized protein n=1 Tax=Pseudovirgaria hyperparasitica TaxID=470096 RepID=A0A6A6WHU1_9PEZI|nr:uncharacterized protein EJ05DRAFT_256786 [Pseudovirgaria hyperparasitica]KAF2761217.1 hypothetical protein EJ05DRAFT_256786 [Pseudovirgaria hyperparasitica]